MIQRIQMAIALYESYVYRWGTFLAIVLASAIIYSLQSDELVWSYSGLFVGAAYAIAAFSSFKRFQPDMMTAAYAAAPFSALG